MKLQILNAVENDSENLNGQRKNLGPSPILHHKVPCFVVF